MVEAYEVFGRVDAIVNCAGIFDIEPIAVRESINRWATISLGFFTNILGCYYTAYYFTLLKGDQEGLVINAGPMISDIELCKLSKFFTISSSLSKYTAVVAENFSKHNIRYLNISPSSMETVMPGVNYQSCDDIRRALVMDSVIKRYNNHEEFVNLVLYAITNSHLNGVELELGDRHVHPPMVAKI